MKKVECREGTAKLEEGQTESIFYLGGDYGERKSTKNVQRPAWFA